MNKQPAQHSQRSSLTTHQEVTTMKLRAITFAIAAVACTGSALAVQTSETLPTVTVPGAAGLAGCVPSSNPGSDACKALQGAVLKHFPAWQLGVIYGPDTPHQAFVDTGAKDRLAQKLARFLDQYAREYQAASIDTHASVAEK